VLASPDREITFKVPPGDAAELSEGTSVTFSYRSSSYPAHISQAPATPLGGVVPIVALFDSLSKPLPFGAIGSVSYRLSLGKGVIVPISSLQTSGNQEFVFAVQDGKAVKVPLSVIGESGTEAATVGLKPGTRIVLNPPPGLLDGSKVTIAAADASNG
jgi:HlyD family secretion protein